MGNRKRKSHSGYNNYIKKLCKFGVDKKKTNSDTSSPVYTNIAEINNETDLNNNYLENDANNLSKFCQTDLANTKSIGIQTENYFSDYKTLISDFTFQNLKDLFEIFVDSFHEWNSINLRIFSLIIYIILRTFRIKYTITEEFLDSLNLLSIRRCQFWLKEIFRNDDIAVVLNDNRGKYRRHVFYEIYPELEIEAKAFALENSIKKKSDFTVYELAKFIDKRFKELYKDDLRLNFTENAESDGGALIRSVESCRLDLKSWGCKWDSVKNRPYFIGHENEDVVKSRNDFIKYFLENKHLYYTAYGDEKGSVRFKKPEPKSRRE